MIMPNGDKLQGHFKNNKLNGPGDITNLEKNTFQKGHFVNGSLFGKGTVIHYENPTRTAIK
jgi:hypothetical protein